MEKSLKLHQFAVAINAVSSGGWFKSVAVAINAVSSGGWFKSVAVAINAVSSGGWFKSVAVVVDAVDSSRLGFKPKTLFLLFLLGSPTRARQHSVCAMAQLKSLFCFLFLPNDWGQGVGGGGAHLTKSHLGKRKHGRKKQQLLAHRQKSTKLMKTWKSMGRLASTPLTGSADSVSLSPLPPASPTFPSSPWTEVMTIMEGSYLSAEQKLNVIHIATVLRDLVHSFITPVHFCFCLVTDFCCKCPCTCVCCCMSLHVLFACLLLWFGLVSFVYFSRFLLLLSRFFVGQLTWFLS